MVYVVLATRIEGELPLPVEDPDLQEFNNAAHTLHYIENCHLLRGEQYNPEALTETFVDLFDQYETYRDLDAALQMVKELSTSATELWMDNDAMYYSAKGIALIEALPFYDEELEVEDWQPYRLIQAGISQRRIFI